MPTRPGGRPTDTKGRYVRISIAADKKIREAAAKGGQSFIRALDLLLKV